ncbi:DUF885 domain-containing protein [Angustibacter sp. McL0619]|uniref:DUF885 domain-containing protein n=1 Tax=Angustibacter sp. McL0619 TaxID=3415676 RepID=UPI003CE6E10E
MTDTTAEAPRRRTAVDAIADAHLDAETALDPIAATYLGVPGYETELTDYSPQGSQERREVGLRTLRALEDAEPADDVDRVTIAAMRERLGLAEELYSIDADDHDLNVLASPLQSIRSVYDLMRKDTADDWATIATRLTRTPEALAGYVESLRVGMARGVTPARRQVEQCAVQAGRHGSAEGFFAELAAGARAGDAELPAAVATELGQAAAVAAHAYDELARFLREELLPVARQADAVGREEYGLRSRYFLGAEVDLDETYEWGRAELARIEAEMREVAEQIRPGSTIDEAMQALDDDPARQLEGTDSLQAWMQKLSDAAVSAMAGTHFDIPDPVRRLECCIAPTHEGGIYYTGPSEDFSRPGRMWWSVPDDVTTFGTWRETTTVYHEGVPGHHLQVAHTVYRSALLNRWRRLGCWVSGHGEGWALYAERLMSDLGFLDDPGDRMGMLDGQRMRAARVVLDIGVHCGLPAPAELGGGTWDADKAWEFFRHKANMAESILRFEVDRYLGWPGQAPSYKVGERLWLDVRDQVRAREGDAFDLAGFHRRALDLGSVGLDVLREALLP